MKIKSLDRYKAILIALKKAGLKTVEVEKKEKKTVITVSPRGTILSCGH